MGNNSNIVDVIKAVLREAGSDMLEISAYEQTQFSVSALRGEISDVSRSGTGGAAVRAVLETGAQQKLGSAYSEKIDKQSLLEIIAQAKRNAQYMGLDVGNGICEEAGEFHQDIGVGSGWPDEDQAKRFALELDSLCETLDKRVINVSHAGYYYTRTETLVATSLGRIFSASSREGSLHAGVFVSDGSETEYGECYEVFRDPSSLDVYHIARTAVERGARKLGAKEPRSGEYTCVLDAIPASMLIGAFLDVVSAESMQKGRSKLAGKIDSRIGSDAFTIIDDPKVPGYGKESFDSEGLLAPAITIFDKGFFREALYNVYAARREGRLSNGRGFRDDLKSRPMARAINAYIPDGTESLEALLAEAGNGIYLTELEGVHVGLNLVSGDFSCSAKGFEIVSGKLGGALRNFTIAGNFYELARNLVSRSNDRCTFLDERFTCPSLLIEHVAISGR